MLKILVVDNNQGTRETVRNYLVRYNYQVYPVNNCHEGMEIIKTANINVVLVDVDSCGENILNNLDILQRFNPGIIVVLTGAGDDPSMAIEALKQGATDYLVKPLDLNKLIDLLGKLEVPVGDDEEEIVEDNSGERFLGLDEIKGENTGFRELIERARLYAISNSPILITGPTGSGKGVLARAIHKASGRHEKPYIEINCAAIPDHLFESEIFGYEAGAFTDAYKTKKGMIEIANRGSFYCDEIGDMSHTMQSQLLKVIEEKKFYHLGGQKEISVDVRIIASTNHDLKTMIKEGKFREDLYYRLAVALIELPSLQSRPEDIIPLARKFIKEFCERNNIPTFTLAPDAMDALLKYSWPGNIRELRNIIERTLIPISGGTILPSDLPEQVSGIKPIGSAKPSPLTGTMTLKNIEMRYILNVLKRVEGNRDKAAKILGISRSTLFEKLKKYGLKHKD